MAEQKTKREVELEIELWRERANSVKNAVSALNLQATVLEFQSKECASQVVSLTAELDKFTPPAEEPAKPPEAPTAAPPEASSAPPQAPDAS